MKGRALRLGLDERVDSRTFRRARHYSRLGAMAGKLRGLLTRHDWGRVDQVAAEEAARWAFWPQPFTPASSQPVR
jgi:hypothetical protein